jgi:hypothetical protein
MATSEGSERPMFGAITVIATELLQLMRNQLALSFQI